MTAPKGSSASVHASEPARVEGRKLGGLEEEIREGEAPRPANKQSKHVERTVGKIMMPLFVMLASQIVLHQVPVSFCQAASLRPPSVDLERKPVVPVGLLSQSAQKSRGKRLESPPEARLCKPGTVYLPYAVPDWW